MNTITVDKTQLRERVQRNRDAHKTIFIQATEAFHERYIAEVTKFLEDAKNGLRYELTIHLPRPEDHTADYDRVLEMIDMSVGDTMDLEELDVAYYIQDDWAWKRAWVGSTLNYTNGAL
jgi:hypothetical protein